MSEDNYWAQPGTILTILCIVGVFAAAPLRLPVCAKERCHEAGIRGKKRVGFFEKRYGRTVG